MVKNYEEIYRKSELYWGAKPSDLVKRFAELAPTGAALDLGMGEGRDALYLAALGFTVTGVESAQSGVSKCLGIARKKNLPVKAISADVRAFPIPKNRYALIVAINLFQFLTKTEAQNVIDRAVAGLKRGGLLVCESFTIDDPHFKAHKQKSHEIAPGTFRDASGNIYSLYSYGEILKMACGDQSNDTSEAKLRPVYYSEFDYYDTTHGPAHWHGVVDFVGKKL